MKTHVFPLFLLLLTGGANAAQSLINVGTSGNDGTGDSLRTAFTKTNANFTELYSTRLSSAPSANGVSLVSSANYAAMRALLDLEAGTDFLSPSAIAAAYQPLLTAGSGISIIGATITATGGAFDSAADYTVSGDWAFTGALTLGNLSVTTLNAAALQIASVAVTSSAAELNVLDGISAGLTADELSVLDDVPAGLTATEIGYSDGVTSAIQTQLDAKAPNAETQTGVHATPSTTNPLSPTWTGPMHTVWYGATGTINLPAAAGYTGRGLMVYNTGSFTVTIDSNGSEVIVRDGTVQTGGVNFTLSSGAGNFVALISDGARWVTLGYKGTLSLGS